MLLRWDNASSHSSDESHLALGLLWLMGGYPGEDCPHGGGAARVPSRRTILGRKTGGRVAPGDSESLGVRRRVGLAEAASGSGIDGRRVKIPFLH